MEGEKRYSRTVSTAEFTETPRVVLEQPTGEVYVEAWDRPEVEVSVSSSGMFEIQQSGSQITIVNMPGKFKVVNFLEPAIEELGELGIDVERVAARVERKIERSMRRAGKGFHFHMDLGNWGPGRDYQIKVPHNCHLSLRTSSGDLRIEGVEGTHLLQTTSGNITLRNLAGNALVNTASGDVGIEGLEGKLALRTASGDMVGTRLGLDELSTSTASGDINFEMVRVPERDFEVRTVSGDITLKLPTDARLTAEVHTLSGDISTGYERGSVDYELVSRRQTTLKINGGGTKVRIHTVSGDVVIRPVRGQQRGGESGQPTEDLFRREGGEERVARVAPERNERQQAELEILQAVERGELSPQEAMQRLNDLGRR